MTSSSSEMDTRGAHPGEGLCSAFPDAVRAACDQADLSLHARIDHLMPHFLWRMDSNYIFP